MKTLIRNIDSHPKRDLQNLATDRQISCPQDFSDLPTDDPNCVLLGLAPSHFHYERLNEAFRLIQDEGATLVAIHKAKYLKRKDGLAIGPGTMQRYSSTLLLGFEAHFGSSLEGLLSKASISGDRVEEFVFTI